jgi:hypothetical protein
LNDSIVHRGCLLLANLKGFPPTKRLELSESFNAMLSHRVRLSNPTEVDKELPGWLKQACEAAKP